VHGDGKVKPFAVDIHNVELPVAAVDGNLAGKGTGDVTDGVAASASAGPEW
jgi:hypothetical protein